MRILKFKGKTEEIVLKQIEKEYGSKAMIIHTQKEESTGHFKWFKSPRIVVTVAVKEESDMEATQSVVSDYETSVENMDENQVNAPIKERTEASYELLKELRAELGALHHEIGELKKAPKVLTTHIGVEESPNKLAVCIEEKLINLGVKKEICQQLLAQIDSEDSELFIRELYG